MSIPLRNDIKVIGDGWDTIGLIVDHAPHAVQISYVRQGVVRQDWFHNELGPRPFLRSGDQDANPIRFEVSA